MSVKMQQGMSPLRRAVRKIEDDIIQVPSKSSLFLDDFKDNQMRLVFVEDDSVYLVCRKGQELFFSTTFDREQVVTESEASELDGKVERKYHTPSFDSGWLNVTNDEKGTIEHGLGTQMLRIFAYFKRSDGLVFPLNCSFVNSDYSDVTTNLSISGNHSGIQFVMLNNKEILYSTQDSLFTTFNHINKDGVSTEYVDDNDGKIRVLVYRTGVTS